MTTDGDVFIKGPTHPAYCLSCQKRINDEAGAGLDERAAEKRAAEKQANLDALHRALFGRQASP